MVLIHVLNSVVNKDWARHPLWEGDLETQKPYQGCAPCTTRESQANQPTVVVQGELDSLFVDVASLTTPSVVSQVIQFVVADIIGTVKAAAFDP